MAEWIRAAKVSEIEDGKAILVNLESKPIALFRAGKELYAISNTCPHRGGPLSEGYLEGLEVTCPWHAWTFDVKTGACGTIPDAKIQTYPVKIESGEVFVQA